MLGAVLINTINFEKKQNIVWDILKQTIPLFLYYLVNFSFTLVDSIMIARVSESSLGAVGQAGIFFNVVMMFFIGILTIYTPLMSRLNINENPLIAKSRLISSIGISLIFSVILFVLFSFTGKFFILFNQPVETTQLVEDYINILKYSVFINLIYHLLVQTVNILNKTKIILYTVLGGNILNVFLNWVLIYGNLGFERYEIVGAAIATVFSRVVMLIILILFLNKKLPFSIFKIEKLTFDKAFLKDLVFKGTPKGVNSVNDWFVSFLLVLFIGWGGVTYIAGNQVSDLLSSLMYMLPQAFCIVITIRVSKMLGQTNDGKELKSNIKNLFKVIIPLNIAFLILIYFSLPLLISMFSLTPLSDAYNLAYDIMLVHLFFFMFYSFQYFFVSILDSFLDISIPSAISIATSYLFVLPLAFFFIFYDMGPVFVWIADGLGNLILSIVFYFRVKNHLKNQSSLDRLIEEVS